MLNASDTSTANRTVQSWLFLHLNLWFPCNTTKKLPWRKAINLYRTGSKALGNNKWCWMAATQHKMFGTTTVTNLLHRNPAVLFATCISLNLMGIKSWARHPWSAVFIQLKFFTIPTLSFPRHSEGYLLNTHVFYFFDSGNDNRIHLCSFQGKRFLICSTIKPCKHFRKYQTVKNRQSWKLKNTAHMEIFIILQPYVISTSK